MNENNIVTPEVKKYLYIALAVMLGILAFLVGADQINSNINETITKESTLSVDN